ncbi:extracellular matrix regulator RemB [Calidifontibacillus oryziterrae]|uniref:extracellular matrix regulator RemB n=1 Tax=Calidifontibacillus oryziterrae TaxID=1191699 RepID=UPI0002EF9BEA|nr:extracellular matrix/biofilm biosynthesis regulator RemA family protein [Calidifontibacillus oryziterrae]
MFIHLGEDVIIQSDNVVAIIDSSLMNSIILEEFVKKNYENNNIVEIVEGAVKSIVITKDCIYFSPFSTVTLKRRSQYISELEM